MSLRCSHLRALSPWFLLFVLIALFGQPHVACTQKAETFVDPMKHDLFLVTPKSFDAVISSYRNKDGVAVLLHFKSTQSSDKEFINTVYNPAAKEAKGMARFGAIDCHEWKKFCQKHSNPKVETPFVVVYPPNPFPPTVLAVSVKLAVSMLTHVCCCCRLTIKKRSSKRP